MASRLTQSSNVTELSFAEEVLDCIGVLPGSPVWYKLDPNSYADFGADNTLTPRVPITKDRQKRKGVITDVDASGGFNLDLTYDNVWRLLQGFFFKETVEHGTTVPMNAAAIVITDVNTTDDEYTAASGLDTFKVGDLILGEGFAEAANNGLHIVNTVVAATDVQVDENLVDETPSATASIKTIGFQFTADDIDVVVTGDLPVLLSAGGTVLTTLGLVPGEWIWIGGDGALTDFDEEENNGWARVKSITATEITLDKADSTMVAETSSGTILLQIFYGERLANDTDGENIDRKSYNLERTLGEDSNGTQSEYLVGATPNEMTFNISEADKVTMDLSFVAQNHENRNGTTGVKSGARAAFAEEGAFNTSSDISRIRINTVDPADENPTSLVAYINELTLTVSNGVFPNKAIGVTGAIEMGEALFDVNGSMTAYFADTLASDAVKANNNVTIDFAIVKDNAGFVVDVPLIALGGGSVDVVAQEAIKMPLEMEGAKDDTLEYTMSMTRFPYLPTVAG